MNNQIDIVALLTQKGRDYQCTECKGKVFNQKHVAREVAAMESPNGQKIRGYLPVYICNECGTMIKESWMPDEKEEEPTAE